MSYSLPTGVPVRRAPGAAERARSVAVLLVFVVIGATAGAVGVVVSLGPSLGWYPATPRVTWAPPPAVLTSVRAGLFLAMAVAEWSIWLQRRERRVNGALGLFIAQQVMTTAWPVLFWAGYGVLGLVDLWITFTVLLVLDALVVATVLAFWRLSRPAAVVMGLHLASCLTSTALVLGSAGMHAVL